MISINKQGNAIVIEFTDNDKYLFNGTIEVAPNELMIVIDESNMATFKRSTNGDTLFSQLINKIQIGGTNVTKDTILDEFAKIGFTTGNSVNSVNGQTGDVVITATSLGAITKSDADTLYAAKSDLNSKADKTSVYTKAEADEKFATNVELNHVKSELANKADTSSLNGKVDKVEGKSLVDDTEIARLATLTNYDDTEVKNLIATKANSADVYTKTESDAKYLTEHQSLANYATKEELSLKANSSDIPTKTSQLVNDSGYLTEHQSLENYATKSEIPTLISQLTNDSGYITSIPSEYVTETELESKGYLTEHQSLANYVTKDELPDISGLATKSEIPTATSQLTNDSGFITEIPAEYITETELTSSLSTKADSANVYTKAEIDNMIGDISARLDVINGEVI